MTPREPAGLHCPGCGQHAALALPGQQQAFCANEDCAILMWDAAKTAGQLHAGMYVIDVRRLGP